MHIIDYTSSKAVWDILEKLYENKRWNRKFMLLQELFEMSMKCLGNMDEYLRNVKEKMSELAIIDLKLNNDIKLAIIFNELSEKYRYLIIALKQQEKIDFDELMTRLLEEAQHHEQEDFEKMAMYINKKSICHYCGQKGYWRKNCSIKVYRERLNGDDEQAKEKSVGRIVM